MDVVARKKAIYLHNFKMQLYVTDSNRNINSITVVRDEVTGVTVPAVQAIAACLNFVKTAALENISGIVSINHHEVLWIVTIPAIWTMDAQQLMKEASSLAGLTDSDKFSLVLEPEAASMWCLADSKNDMHTGDTYIVADCGGGTIDVTVHEVTGSNSSAVKETRDEATYTDELPEWDAYRDFYNHQISQLRH
ncbi:Heat shock 70 kDa protein 12A [Physocladia obscura]|uniref:Heat shock 70 kDa protein 12A n=1 Tax=Physocladia obscura TaxID=109957 RepID=A0AAD5SUW6_9FUNG|nr:Heat shock 70 kDa protein 12A [Physocladia obscura]